MQKTIEKYLKENAPREYKLIPITEPLNIRTCWEHTPLDYYRYGEYPRFIRPIGAHQPQTKITLKKQK